MRAQRWNNGTGHWKSLGQIQFNNGTNLGESVSFEERVAEASILAFAAVWGSLGNAMVIVAVACRKPLRTKVRFLIVNLALINFVSCFIILPFDVVSIALDGWQFSDELCNVLSSLGHTLAISSTAILALIALNRYIHIAKSVDVYRSLYGGRRFGYQLATVWLASLALPNILVASGIGTRGYDDTIDICNMDRSDPSSLLYGTLLMLAFVPLTSVIIIWSYIRLFLFVREHNAAVMFRAATSSIEERRRPAIPRKEIRLALISLAVIACFVCCYLPSFAAFNIDPEYKHVSLHRITAYVYLLNGALNPFAYAWTDREVRGVFSAKMRPMNSVDTVT
ncbi:alpha-1A adrenergic receptor-like [Ptychodera flava]|uniref:alpha-1A adrenergic receptor-like n=1 Tax=Ptychodera flava TaxID=63121 RepID=UPI00396A6B52